MSSQRTRSKGILVNIFQPQIEDDRGAKKCCEKVLALASSTDTDSFKNDYKTIFFKKEAPTDNCTFELYKDGVKIADLNNSTYGTFNDFGSIDGKEDWTIFRLEWRNVLLIDGVGNYFIRRNISNLGLPSVADDTLCYELWEFSFEIANRSVRFESVQDGILEDLNLDFKGLSLEDMIRVRGFFGGYTPKISQDNVVRTNNDVVQLRQNNYGEYLFKSEFLNYYTSQELINFHFKGYPLLVSDYNKYNHSYDYKETSIILESVETPKYLNEQRSRKALFSAKFRDQKENKRKINY